MKYIKKYKNAFVLVLAVPVLLWQAFDLQGDDKTSSFADNQNQRLVELYKSKQSDEFLTVSGRVYRLLADDNKGSRHQRFLIYVHDVSVLVAHNIDLAARVPLAVGDSIILHGEYEYNDKGGVLHWTHHDPQGRHNGGWISYKGKRYQ